MKQNLVFCNFKDKELYDLKNLLCKIFVTTRSQIASLYQDVIDDFQKDGWPPHFVNRNFFKSEDPVFQEIYKRSPSVAVDLPSLFELDNGEKNKPTIVILGQDSKSDQDSEEIHLGTPYGLHHRGSREILNRTKLYFKMITIFLEAGYRVYLTDIHKIWVCNPNRPYDGINLPKGEQEKFVSVLKEEFSIINPVALVTWGKVSANSVRAMKLDIQHLNFPHPSGSANGAWSKIINKSPTDENKLAYWNTVISEALLKEIQ